ncbi:ATP-binding protein [Sulfuricurvum sp.]|uniref:ATP-binding protein n=1 Tax=Sulfuricurvum sp. TaxID=2025608 RepID=UPI002E37B84F|nr:ATP-binding protein [Sulfuricurvum sp.]HEX5330196.1 ATP-binding protein [Sulfuricurvum sp.]
MNLTHKFIIAIVLITSLVVSAFTYLQINEQKEILNNELNQRVSLIRSNLESNAKNNAISLKYEVENDIATFNFSHIDADFKNLVTKDEIDAIVLFNIDKTKELFAGQPYFKNFFPKNKIDSLTIREINNKNNFIISLPIVLNDKWGEMHIVYSLKQLKEEVKKAEENKKLKIQSSVRKAIFTSVVLASILLIFSYFFARKLISPILVLTDTAKEIASGNLDVSEKLSAIKSNDEIGLLATSFVEMAKQLDASYKELYVLNTNLENKTLELQELNASLEQRVAQKVAQITEQEKLMISQSRLAAMGEMMSMVAHQWRQPLATITLMIADEKIKSLVSSKESDETDKILDKISDIIIYLSNLINDFQTYFKPDKSTENISTALLIERMEQIIQTRIQYEKVQMHCEIGENVFIETYANEVVQVLINIVNNAIDILVERNQIDRHIWINIMHNSEHVTISVEDNGGGIANSIIDHVFDPYFSTKSKNGTGIGLYMAKMIIEKHIGGVLSVTNTKEGACFAITLPKRQNERGV